MQTRQVGTLSALDSAYIAGLVDREGTVTLSRRHARDSRQLVLSISNTEPPILEHVLEVIGCGKITNKKTAKTSHTPSLTYSVANRQALAVLAQIEPYLHSYKRLRARLALDLYLRLTPRNGKYTAGLRAQRTAFEARFLALRANGTSGEPRRPAEHDMNQ